MEEVETTATGMLAHVQRFAVASTTAKEITYEDVEMVRRFGAAFLTVVFELPLSDVTVVDGENAVLECRVATTPAAEVTWYVENVEISQTGDCHIVSIEQESIGVTVTIRIRPDEGRRQVEGRNDVDAVERRSHG